LAGDITYIPTVAGWRYLAVIIDLFSRRIVGWAFADHMRTELVTAILVEISEAWESGKSYLKPQN
jgi:transposase InsO family protein